MKIVDVIASPGLTGFYFDDQQAIKEGVTHDGFTYNGEPKTPGFKAVRQRGESISVMLILEDGQVASGDCAAVQYSGAAGRDPLFLAEDFIPIIIEAVLYAKKFGVGAYVGGSCNETDGGARTAVHVSLASRPDQMLAKPGMGVDEGFMIVYNEMNRTLAVLARVARVRETLVQPCDRRERVRETRPRPRDRRAQLGL